MEPVEISAGRLHLRPWTPYDEDAVLAACQDPEIPRWVGTVPSPYTREHAHTFVTRTAPSGWASGSEATWAVLDATTGEPLACVGLHELTAETAMAGYWCSAEARGSGVTSDALAAVCRWAFAAQGLDRIGWTSQVGNWASRAVAEKCGFTVEGVARRSLRFQGAFVDAWVGSLLRDDELVDRRPLPRVPALTDGAVSLRPFRPEDAADVRRACDDPETARWLPVPVPYRLEDGRAYVEHVCPAGWADGTSANFAVVDATTGELLGDVGLKLPHRDPLRCGEVGYWTAPWARGRGAAGRAARLVAEWGLRELGLNRVELLADVDNAASQRAAEKAGFVREGVAHRARPDRSGTGQDMVQYSLVRSDAARTPASVR